MDKKIIAGIAGLISIASGAFYGGMSYGKSSATTPTRGQFAVAQNGRQAGMSARGAGTVFGEIIARDETSITVKMPDGSTKIVLVSASAQVGKSVAGSATDLVAGVTVMVTGSANSDGSVTAESVQIRPAGSPPFGGMRKNQ
ncbi:MAG: hypothetical protein AAB421_02040 [Patescibacteria group bacterium]